MFELLDLLLAGTDQPQADQLNSLAEGPGMSNQRRLSCPIGQWQTRNQSGVHCFTDRKNSFSPGAGITTMCRDEFNYTAAIIHHYDQTASALPIKSANNLNNQKDKSNT
eukprot:1149766-Pelagomonas_calceolata.AAC.16